MSILRRPPKRSRPGFMPGLESLERRDCPAVVSVSGLTSPVNESGGAVTFIASLSQAQSQPVEVRYATGGTASGTLDYHLQIGSAKLRTPSGSFRFPANTKTLTITLTPLNDIAREGDENFQFTLLSARGHTLGNRSVSSTIADDDNYTASIIGLASVASGTVTTYEMRLSSPATRRELLYVSTRDRSASAPSDYVAMKDMLIAFQPGQSVKTFTLTTRPNSLGENHESFVVNVRPASPGFPAVSPFTVTILGAAPPPTPPPGPPLPTATFTQDYGWGVVNASAATAKLLGLSTAFPEVTDLVGVNWGNDVVRAPEVWARGHSGQGIVVAVIDTGVDYTHPGLVNSMWVNPREVPNDGIDNDNNGFVDDVRGWDFHDFDNDPMDEIGFPNLQGGHGTHVAGTIAAAGSLAGPRGVAYDAKIMPIRIFDDVIGAHYLSRAISYAATSGAHIINLSLRWTNLPEVTDAIRFATSLGSIVVIASGNNSRPVPSYPAALATLPGVIAVGAVDSTRTVASFSNRAGTSSTLQFVAAPGVSVTSTVPKGYPGATQTPSGTFDSFNGTSMAAPHVAGVVALMLSAVPDPRAPGVRDRVVNALISTSQQ